jgi:putative membrane protein
MRTLIGALCALLVGASPQAEPPSNAQDQAASLAGELHSANLFEIEAGGLAAQNGSDEVRAYGRMLVDDHRRADVALIGLATRLGLSLGGPQRTQLDADHRALLLEDLRQVHGPAFDKPFLVQMHGDHERLLSDVQAARARLPDGSELALLVDREVPALQKHREAARRMLEKLVPQARRPERR